VVEPAGILAITVGTAKRERQKANKAMRQQELAQAEAKARTTRLALIIGAAIVGVFVLVFVAGQFVGDDEDPVDTVVPAVDEPVEPVNQDENGDEVPVVAEPDADS